jgi:hypothetical protein
MSAQCIPCERIKIKQTTDMFPLEMTFGEVLPELATSLTKFRFSVLLFISIHLKGNQKREGCIKYYLIHKIILSM